MADAKQCTKCGHVKSLDSFPKHKRKKDKHGSQCKDCVGAYYVTRRDLVPTILECSICKQQKPLGDFRWNPKFGNRTECKECEKSWLRCSVCKEVKPIDDFFPFKRNSTGRASHCKDCHLTSQHHRFHTDKEFRKRHRERQRTPKAAGWRRRYNKLPEVILRKEKYKSIRAAQLMDQWHNNPFFRMQHKARVYLNRAVETGKLIKPSSCQANGRYGNECQGECGKENLQGHHHLGYWPKAVWLEVEWLCVPCHNVADQMMRDAGMELIVKKDNPVLEKILPKIELMTSWLNVSDDELFKIIQSCSGEDEMDVLLNFSWWLKEHGYSITKSN